MSPIHNETIQTIQSTFFERTVKLPDGTSVPRLGQGTWYMAEDPLKRKEEIGALRLGVELGMNLLDTAEMYGEGRSETLVGEAIQEIRDDVFLVSKVYPHNAGLNRIVRSCEQSLQRLQTDRLDLYLLHWRGNVPLNETVEGMERLVKEGKILRWGVSNFDMSDIKELSLAAQGAHCATNQVLYHLGSRGIEYELLPWQRDHHMPIMAYCPLAQAGSLRRGLIEHPSVKAIAEQHQVKPLQLLLAWCIRNGDVIAIPKASSKEHVVENAAAGLIDLTEENLIILNDAFPMPTRKMPLDMV
jgi:diketogulonate reductase-like aldo/keto reductase